MGGHKLSWANSLVDFRYTMKTTRFLPACPRCFDQNPPSCRLLGKGRNLQALRPKASACGGPEPLDLCVLGIWKNSWKALTARGRTHWIFVRWGYLFLRPNCKRYNGGQKGLGGWQNRGPQRFRQATQVEHADPRNWDALCQNPPAPTRGK